MDQFEWYPEGCVIIDRSVRRHKIGSSLNKCVYLSVATFITAYLIFFLIDYKQKTLLHLLYFGHEGGLSLRDILRDIFAWGLCL